MLGSLWIVLALVLGALMLVVLVLGVLCVEGL